MDSVRRRRAHIDLCTGCQQKLGKLIAPQLKVVVQRQSPIGVAHIQVRVEFNEQPRRIHPVLRHSQVNQSHRERVARPDALVQIRRGIGHVGILTQNGAHRGEISRPNGVNQAFSRIVQRVHVRLQSAPARKTISARYRELGLGQLGAGFAAAQLAMGDSPVARAGGKASHCQIGIFETTISWKSRSLIEPPRRDGS